MGLKEFLTTDHTDWPLGKLQTLHQSHELAADAPITHPLLADDFLKTADVIRITVHGPKTLSLVALKDFMRQVAAIVR